MNVLSQNAEDMLKRLEAHSQSELTLIRALADAVRRVDDQTLRELRNLTLQHELRRETILSELQHLASRMCQLPNRASATQKAAIEQPAYHSANREAVDVAPDPEAGMPNAGSGADWRQAARNIEEDLDYAFGKAPRH